MDRDSSVLTGREVLIGVTGLASVVVFGCAIRLSHRHRDAARHGFLYLRIALCAFFVSRLFDLAAFIVSNSGGSSSSDMSTISLSAIQAILGLTAVHLLLTQLTDVLILLLLSHLCVGILIANLNELTPVEKIVRRSIPVVGIVLALLTAANVGSTISYYTISPSSPVFQVNMAYQACICTASLLVGGWAIRVKLKTRGVAQLSQASVFLLVCAFLFVVCTAYSLLISANPGNGSRLIFLSLIDVIFSTWPDFIILCLVFAMSTKKAPDGLWTKVEPDTPILGEAAPDTPWTKTADFSQSSRSPTLMMWDPKTGKTWEVQNAQMQQEQQQHPYYAAHELEQPPPMAPQEMYATFPELESPQDPYPVAEIPSEPVLLPNTIAGTNRDVQRERESEEEDMSLTQRGHNQITCNIKLALRKGMDHF
ncbi:unnamed protein product [Clonostachys rosea]|uniref:Uncharacterized protein n=1 Tax=Bionectria ochroleuca TaxID=29856 RepID=A0ABY6UD71_BIOOC|nr:unnamed protein product [Clonostachys rosea]